MARMTRKKVLLDELRQKGFDEEFVSFMSKGTADSIQVFLKNHEGHEIIARLATQAGDAWRNK